MTRRVAVYGLWHLGSVTAACLAEAGYKVIGLDPDRQIVDELKKGRPPVAEPGLAELIEGAMAAGRLRFTTDSADAVDAVDLLWVTFDTPVNDRDEADVGWLRDRINELRPILSGRDLVVLISSQVPTGFTRMMEREWACAVRFAYSPENLRLGRALQAFRHPERVVVGAAERDRLLISELFAPFSQRVEWMSIESAEMTKHALNAFLATSVAFINEVARICEGVGADAKEVERGLKSEPRIGPRSYLTPGAAFAGGTLARDVRFLQAFGRAHSTETPLLTGVLASNERHQQWLFDTVERVLHGIASPTAAVLGLTYKPGTDTLRRSLAIELCVWLRARGVRVQAHDPAVTELPPELASSITLASTPVEALGAADVAIVSTEWPQFRELSADDVVSSMRAPHVIDQNRFLATLAADRRVRYLAVGIRPVEN